MAKTSFTFKPPTGTWFYLALAIVFGGVALNFAIQIVLYQGFTFTALIALFIPILISVPACILFNVCLLRSQYHSIDMGKKLEFDKIKRQLKVCKNNNIHIINHEDIKCVELHKSYTNFSILYLPGYMKLNLLSGKCVIITDFLASEYDLEELIENFEVVEVTRLLYRINASDLQNSIC